MRRWATDLERFWWVVAILAILLILPPLLPRFYVYVLALLFVTALLAMSNNLALGYGGMIAIHHCVFYGVGAYAMVLVIMRMPLPMWIGFLVGPVAAAAVGLLIGWFCVKLRGIYFGFLALALGTLAWAVVYKWYGLTKGDDGIHDIPVPSFLASVTSSYYFILVIVSLCLMIMYLIVKSPFGSMLQATRDNPQRSEAVGINVRRHRLIAFVIASFFAGVAGVLVVVIERSISPAMMFWELSAEVVFMCLLGGMFTFMGPVVGAAVVVLFRTFVGIYTEYWTLILGVLLVLLILFLPGGVLGYFLERFKPRARAILKGA